MRISDWSSDVCSSDLVRDAHRFEFERTSRFLAVPVLGDDPVTCLVEHVDPVRDKGAITGRLVDERVAERRTDTAARSVPHYHDLGDFELRHPAFDRGGRALAAPAHLIVPHQIGALADDDNLAARGIEPPSRTVAPFGHRAHPN